MVTFPQFIPVAALAVVGLLSSPALADMPPAASAAVTPNAAPVAAANPTPVRFGVQVQAVLTKLGCNQGICHGNTNGKGGFKLSLRGEDAEFDYESITRGALARRVNRYDPDASLLLRKPAGIIPHEGGVRFDSDSPEYRTLRDWIAAGFPPDPAGAPHVSRVEVSPESLTLTAPVRSQTLSVKAHFSDGAVRDVTATACYDSSDPAFAISAGGVVSAPEGTTGEVSVLVRYLDKMAVARITFLQSKPGFVWADVPENNFIDRHAFAKLRALQVRPSELSSDSVFLRRVFVDALGTLPTADEARAFLADRDPAKRAKLIDAVLARPEYVDLWALKWADVLRVDPLMLDFNGAARLDRRIRRDIATDKPLDAFVRELLIGVGSTYSDPAAAYYRVHREPDELAENTAQVFLGIRLKCAKCHNHPFERWTQADYTGLAAFFARVKRKMPGGYFRPTDDFLSVKGEELISVADEGEYVHPKTGKPVRPRLPGDALRGVPPREITDEPADRREVLAAWLTAGRNPFFARAMANRIWFHLTGRGLVEPIDDFRDSNPAINGPLLDALAGELVRNGFRAKELIRTILNSRTYQLSSEPNEDNKGDQTYLARAEVRRLWAEVLLDAVCQVTEAPETFAGFPAGTRAVQITGGSTRSHPFLKLFGKPKRLTVCDCERNNDETLVQSLRLINGSDIASKVLAPNNRIGRLFAAGKSDDEVVEELYLAAFARPPTDDERERLREYRAKTPDRRRWSEDVLWALLNSKGFLFRR